MLASAQLLLHPKSSRQGQRLRWMRAQTQLDSQASAEEAPPRAVQERPRSKAELAWQVRTKWGWGGRDRKPAACSFREG